MRNRHNLLVALTVGTSILLTSLSNAYADEVPTFRAKVGELKKITFKLTIPVTTQQEFAYAIQLKNEEGFTEQLSWVQGTLQEGQEIRPQQSWVPLKAGEYTVEIFVFSCISCLGFPNVLTMKVIVEE